MKQNFLLAAMLIFLTPLYAQAKCTYHPTTPYPPGSYFNQFSGPLEFFASVMPFQWTQNHSKRFFLRNERDRAYQEWSWKTRNQSRNLWVQCLLGDQKAIRRIKDTGDDLEFIARFYAFFSHPRDQVEKVLFDLNEAEVFCRKPDCDFWTLEKIQDEILIKLGESYAR